MIQNPTLIALSGKMGHGKDTVADIIQLLCWESTSHAWNKKMGYEETVGDFTDEQVAQALSDHQLLRMLHSSPHNVWKRKQFAAAVKQICALLLDVDVKRFEDQAFKNTELGPEWDLWGIQRDAGQYGPGAWFGSRAELEHSAWYRNYPEPKNLTARELAEFDKNHYIVRKQRTVRDLLQMVGTDAGRDVIHPHIWINTMFAGYKPVTSENSNHPDSHMEVGLDVMTQHYPHWLITDMRFQNEFDNVCDRGGLTIRINRPDVEIRSLHPSETSLDRAEFHEVIENDGSLEQLVQRVRAALIKYKVLPGS